MHAIKFSWTYACAIVHNMTFNRDNPSVRGPSFQLQVSHFCFIAKFMDNMHAATSKVENLAKELSSSPGLR